MVIKIIFENPYPAIGAIVLILSFIVYKIIKSNKKKNIPSIKNTTRVNGKSTAKGNNNTVNTNVIYKGVDLPTIVAILLTIVVIISLFLYYIDKIQSDKNTTQTQSTPLPTQVLSPYHQKKLEIMSQDNISNVVAYLIDLDGNDANEMIVTYESNGIPHLSIYYMQNEEIVTLFEKSASIGIPNENPQICYMITTDLTSDDYYLRERVVEENRVRNTYYIFQNNLLSPIKNIYEGKNDYNGSLNELKQYPVIITTDPVHYAVTDGIKQLSQI